MTRLQDEVDTHIWDVYYLSTSDEEDNDSELSDSEEELDRNSIVHDTREFAKQEETKEGVVQENKESNIASKA